MADPKNRERRREQGRKRRADPKKHERELVCSRKRMANPEYRQHWAEYHRKYFRDKTQTTNLLQMLAIGALVNQTTKGTK
jgi:hypothetical protein